ncbi:N-acetylmuramoyl-L-alanine amidase [compost metagenome]
MGTVARADKYSDQIEAIEREVQGYDSEASKLAAQSDSLQKALGLLQNQASTIQAQIDLSQAKYDQLIVKIAETEQKIKDNQDGLGEVLANLYVDEDISPLEMLASSSNISEYLDKQEYRNSIRDSLTRKIGEIKQLKTDLDNQKVDVKRVLDDQQSQRAALVAKQREQQTLLNQTKNDENAYRSLSADKNSQIEKLREEQRRANAPAFGGGGIPAPSSGNGGYPAVWANAAQDSLVDNWGLYNRECVSYVAWKVASTGRYVPHFNGSGNANQWPSTLSGVIPQGSTPRQGSALITMAGPYGHVRYVESVNSDGSITVSDYNLGVDGLYRYYTMSPPSGGIYIYF